MRQSELFSDFVPSAPSLAPTGVGRCLPPNKKGEQVLTFFAVRFGRLKN